jgi:hypothetical protein
MIVEPLKGLGTFCSSDALLIDILDEEGTFNKASIFSSLASIDALACCRESIRASGAI